MTRTARRLHALSIDVEDWFHPELVRSRVAAGACVPLAHAATQPILALLERYGVRATFFIVGEAALSCPDLVRQIAAAGHEIGCHTFSHRPLWELTPAALAGELDEWGRALRDILGPAFRSTGFRAPTFSLDQRTAWAVDVLADAGYRYDSSVFPFKNYLYGVAGAPDAPYRLDRTDVSRADAAGRLIEFPMSVWRWGRLALPVAGGAYLRLLPLPLLSLCLRQIERERPIVIYAHPWEMSAQTPRMRLPAFEQLITYANRGAALKKLERLLAAFAFAPLETVLQQGGWL
jgi:polysaccharide deacetylase family protein (PEP-CTERM system associated)